MNRSVWYRKHVNQRQSRFVVLCLDFNRFPLIHPDLVNSYVVVVVHRFIHISATLLLTIKVKSNSILFPILLSTCGCGSMKLSAMKQLLLIIHQCVIAGQWRSTKLVVGVIVIIVHPLLIANLKWEEVGIHCPRHVNSEQPLFL